MFVCLCPKHLPFCIASSKVPKSAPFKSHTITRAQRDDLLWWEAQLWLPFLGLHIIHPPPQLTIDIFIDTSTSWDIGMLVDGRWLAWEFKPGWLSLGRHIGWGERVAVELCICTLISSGFRNVRVRVRSERRGGGLPERSLLTLCNLLPLGGHIQDLHSRLCICGNCLTLWCVCSVFS